MSSRLALIRLARILLLAGLLGGCESWPWRMAAADYSWFGLRAPDSFGAGLQLEQRFRYQDRSVQLDLMLAQSIEANRYAVVLFGPVGGAVFSARWQDGSVRQTRTPMIPVNITAEALLREMQLALWSIIEIRKGIHDSAISVTENELERIIYNGSKPMITIKYDRKTHYAGTVTFNNLEAGHQWILETLSFQPLSASSNEAVSNGGF